MGQRKVNAHNHLSVMLLDLRRHLTGCRNCQMARKGADYDLLCLWTKISIVEISVRWERNIPGRLAAYKGEDPYIFPCPDVNKHGPAYALTAEACVVESKIDKMF